MSGLPTGAGGGACVIAELSGNHNRELPRALELVRAAHAAGADMVKLQTYTADTITMDAPQECFRIRGGPWDGRRLHELYAEASTPWEWHPALAAEADRLGIPWFSTPFDPTAVDFLEGLGCRCYKVASFEVIDIPLLQRVAATRKPVIMSVGMSSLAEIDLAVRTLREGGCPELALLHCISAYPAPAAGMRLANLEVLGRAFACPVGLSDHSPGHLAAALAAGRGARYIEKHLCLRRADGGPDAGFSLEPAEFAALVQAVREAEAMCGAAPAFGPAGAEEGSIVFRKSLFIARDVAARATLAAEDVRVVRPGHGLPPRFLPQVLGRRARVALARGTPLAWDLLE